MKNKNVIWGWLIGGSMVIAACGSGDKAGQGDGTATTGADSVAVEQDNGSKLASAQTAVRFLKWYANKYNDLNNIVTLDVEEGRQYAVNFEGTEKWLEMMASSGMVSDQFIEAERAAYEEIDSDWHANQLMEGPPQGFDYDRVLLTQEIEETIRACEDPKVINATENGETAEVTLDVTMRLKLHMIRDAGVWMVASIEPGG